MPEQRRNTLVCLLLAVITLAVYWPATGFDFINFDDPEYILYNPVVHQGITRAGAAWAFKAVYASNWHPLTWISHMADCSFYGLKPGGHHLTNLLFHSANAALVFLVLLQLTGAAWRSALVAALFSWHPLHVESVAWISERKDVLSAFFWLLTISAYAKYARASQVKGPEGKLWYCLALFCFGLGLLAKPMVVTLPFVLLLLDFWPLKRSAGASLDSRTERASSPSPPDERAGRGPGRGGGLKLTEDDKITPLPVRSLWGEGTRLPHRLLWLSLCIRRAALADGGTPNQPVASSWPRLFAEKIPFFAMAALDCFATFWAQKSSDVVISTAALPFSDRIANALISYVLYLWKTVWPVDLALPYPYSYVWTFGQAAAAGLFLAFLTVLALLQARARPWLIVGWLWFLGTLVPVIGLVQVSVQTMADRYSYLPLVGVFIMIAWAIPGSWARWPRPGLVFGAVILALLVILLAGTEAQLQYWRNSVTLFSHTVSVTPDNLLAEYNLGAALAARGDADPAILHYQKALVIHPNRVEAGYHMQTEVHFNLGLIFRSRKQWAEAEAQFRAFIHDQPNLSNGHFNRATALLGLGRVDEATGEFREALGIDLRAKVPDDAHLFAALDAAYAETGHYSEAIATAEKARAAALALGDQKLAAAAEKRLATYRAVNHP